MSRSRRIAGQRTHTLSHQPQRRDLRRRPRALALAACAAAPALIAASTAAAADGVWSQTAAGNWNWSDVLNWNGGVVANGADATANFNSIDLAGDAVIALDAPATVGNLTFGDTDGATTPAGWSILGPNQLQLQVSSGAPVITVNPLGAGKVVTIDASIASATGLTKAGDGTLVLTGGSGYSGATTISAGALQIGAGGAAGSIGSGSIVDNGQLVFNRSDGIVFGNTISGNGGITKLGANGLVLTAPNTYSGTTTVSAGSLQVGDGATNGTLGSGPVVNNGALLFNRSDTITVANNITGTGGITKQGAATLTLSGNNAFTGAIQVSTGTIVVTGVTSAGAVNLSAGGAAFIVNGGSFTSSALSTVNAGTASQFVFNSGSAAFNGGIRTSNADGGIIRINGGTFTATDMSVQRNGGGAGSPGDFTTGIIQTGGTINATTIRLGTNNSNGAMSIEGGTTNVASVTLGQQTSGTRGGHLRILNGALSVTDTVDGIILNRQNGTSTANQTSNADFLGGVAKVGGFKFGYDANITSGAGTVNLGNGTLTGTLYVGGLGMVKNATSGMTAQVNLVRGTIGALTDWNSAATVGWNLPTGNAAVIAAADDANVAHNIQIDGVISGAGGFTKTGGGILTLTAANLYGGASTVSAGTLQGSAASLRGNITDNANVTFNQSSAGTFTGVISGTGSVTKTGPGALSLGAGQTYTGPTLVNGGTLTIAGAPTTSGITVGSGGALAIGASGTVGALTLGSGAGDTSILGLGSQNGPVTLTVTGSNALTTNGVATLAIGASGLTPGPHVLIDYSGGIGGAGFGAFALSSLPPRITASLVNNASNTSVDLNVTQVDMPRWTGAVNGNWDINTTQNWKEVFSGNNTTYLQSSTPGDNVLFDDQATGTTIVNVTTTVQPASVTVNNTSKQYTLTGAGKISGTTSLLKQGGGTLTLDNTGGNDYSGGTNVTAGTLAVSQQSALPAAGNVTISGGTMALQTNNALPASGAVTVTGGALDLGGVSQNAGGNLSLQGGQIVHGFLNKDTGVFDVQSGTISAQLGGAAGLTKSTAGTVVINGNTNNNYNGVTTVAAGALQLGDGVTNGSIPGNINNSATVVFNNGPDQTFIGQILGTSGTVVKHGPGTLSLTNVNEGNAILNGGTVILVGDTGGAGSFTPRISRGGTVAINAGATLVAANANALGLNSANLPPTVTINTGGTLTNQAGFDTAIYGCVFAGGVVTGDGTWTFRANVSALANTTSTLNAAGFGLSRDVNFSIDTGATVNVASPINGGFGIVKSGAGRMVLTGASASTYTGATTVNGGSLIVNGTLGSPTINVNAGGILGGTTTYAGPVVVNTGTLGSGAVAPGDSNSVGSLTVGSLSLSSAILNFEVNSTGADLLNVTSANALALAGVSTFNISDLGGAAAGTYTLLDYNGTAVADLSNFALGTTTLGSLSLSLVNDTANTSIDLSIAAGGPTNANWNVDADGNWSVAGNWSPGAPNAAGAIANFGPVINAPRTVTVDAPQTTAQLNFNNANKYTIAGTSTLTLDNTSGGVAINVSSGSHDVTAPLVLAKDATISVTPAASVLTLSNLQPSSVGVTKAGDGRLAVNNVRAGSLTINAGSVSILAGRSTARTSKVTSLSIAAGAALDLTNQDLIVDYTGSSPLATIKSLIVSGYNNGSWNGSGIRSSSALTGFNGHATALGYAEASSVGIGAGGGTFSGQSVDNSSVLVRYTLRGDGDLSGNVDLTDFTFLAANFNGTGKSWQQGDFNYDGSVDLTDFTFLAGNFNQTLPSDPSGAPALGAPVPEPATFSMFGLMAAGWLTRRARRRASR